MDFWFLFIVLFTTYRPHSLGQVKKLFWASIPFSINGGNCCADSEKMPRRCIAGARLSGTHPMFPPPFSPLGSGSVLAWAYPRVLTQPSAFLIEICYAWYYSLRTSLKAGLIISVKLIPVKAWMAEIILMHWQCKRVPENLGPLRGRRSFILGKPGWGIFLGATCLELLK